MEFLIFTNTVDTTCPMSASGDYCDVYCSGANALCSFRCDIYCSIYVVKCPTKCSSLSVCPPVASIKSI